MQTREEKNRKSRERYHNNIEKEHARSKKKYLDRLEYYRSQHRDRYREMKITVIEYYSNGTNRCACCGETYFAFLTIDHINGGGGMHRKNIGYGGRFVDWLVRNKFPGGYQVLCFNCNCAKQFNHGCPHQAGGFISPQK